MAKKAKPTERRADPTRRLLPAPPYIDIYDSDVPEHEDWYWNQFSGGGMKLSYPHDGAPAGTVMRDLKASQLESLYRIYGQRTTAFGNAIRKYYNGLLEYISSEHRWKDVYVPFGSTYNGMKMRQVRNKKWMVWCTHATGTQRHRENFPLFFKALRKWLDNPRVYEVTRDVGEYIGGRRSTTWEVEEEDLTDVDYEPEDCEGSEESGEEEDVRHDEQGTETEEFSDSQEEGNEDEVNTVADMDEGEDLPDERPTKRGKKVAHDDFVVDDDDPIILEDSDGASVLAEEDTDSGSDSDDTNFGDPKRSSVEDSDNSADSNSEMSVSGSPQLSATRSLRSHRLAKRRTAHSESELDDEGPLAPPTPVATPRIVKVGRRLYRRLQDPEDEASPSLTPHSKDSHHGSSSLSPHSQNFVQSSETQSDEDEPTAHTDSHALLSSSRSSPPIQTVTPKRKRPSRAPDSSSSDVEDTYPLKRLCRTPPSSNLPTPQTSSRTRSATTRPSKLVKKFLNMY